MVSTIPSESARSRVFSPAPATIVRQPGQRTVSVSSRPYSAETERTPASVEDRGHMEYPFLLGRDILTDYRVDARERADVEETERDEAGEVLEEE